MICHWCDKDITEDRYVVISVRQKNGEEHGTPYHYGCAPAYFDNEKLLDDLFRDEGADRESH